MKRTMKKRTIVFTILIAVLICVFALNISNEKNIFTNEISLTAKWEQIALSSGDTETVSLDYSSLFLEVGDSIAVTASPSDVDWSIDNRSHSNV